MLSVIFSLTFEHRYSSSLTKMNLPAQKYVSHKILKNEEHLSMDKEGSLTRIYSTVLVVKTLRNAEIKTLVVTSYIHAATRNSKTQNVTCLLLSKDVCQR